MRTRGVDGARLERAGAALLRAHGRTRDAGVEALSAHRRESHSRRGREVMMLAAERKTIATTDAGGRLDDLYRSFDHVTSATDPVHIVRRFKSPADREVVGFCAAALAFGRVASVLQSIETLAGILGPHPAAFVRAFDPSAPHVALRG